MIVSFTNGFVFVKTRKTAGTSAEILLSGWCAGPDICSLIAPEDELLRRDFGSRPRNFAREPAAEAEMLAAIGRGDGREIARLHQATQRHRPFGPHTPAHRIRAALPADFWDSAFKFTVERHPYEKAVSLAYYLFARQGAGEAFPPFLDRVVEAGRYRNYDLYSHEGKLLVDEVVPYPALWQRLRALSRSWGKPFPAQLPRAKGQQRQDRRPAAEILSERQKRRVQDLCPEEFALLGFER